MHRAVDTWRVKGIAFVDKKLEVNPELRMDSIVIKLCHAPRTANRHNRQLDNKYLASKGQEE